MLIVVPVETICAPASLVTMPFAVRPDMDTALPPMGKAELPMMPPASLVTVSVPLPVPDVMKMPL